MKKYRLLLLLFFLLVYLVPICFRPVVSPDGYTQMQIASEMLDSNNFIIPTLLGEKFYEKPILGYWVSSVSFLLFGRNDFAARLPGVLAMGLMAYLIWLLITKRVGDEILALLSCALYLGFTFAYIGGSTAGISSLSVLFISGAISLIYLASSEKFYAIRISYLISCGLMVGLAFLCVGFVGYIITFTVSTFYLLAEGRVKKVFVLPLLPLFCSLFIVMPWMVSTYLTDSDFACKFITNTHFQQYFSETSSALFWWQSIPLLIAGTLPTTIFILPAFVGFLQNITTLHRNPFFRFLFFWALVPFLLFIVIDNPPPEYILSVYPPLAILLAFGIKHYLLGGGTLMMDIAVTAGGLAFALLSLYIVTTQSFLPESSAWVIFYDVERPYFIALAILMLIAAGVILLSHKFNPTSQIIIFMSCIGLIALFINVHLPEKYFPDPQRLISELIDDVEQKPQKDDLILTSSPKLFYQLVWYLKNPNVKLLNEVVETHADVDNPANEDSLQEILKKYNHAPVFCFIPASERDMLDDAPIKNEFRTADGKYIMAVF